MNIPCADPINTVMNAFTGSLRIQFEMILRKKEIIILPRLKDYIELIKAGEFCGIFYRLVGAKLRFSVME